MQAWQYLCAGANKMLPEEELNEQQSSGEQPGSEETQETKQEQVTSEPGMESPEMKIAELEDRYVRLFAEFDNFKRRTSKERIEFIQQAGKDIIVSLLPVLDDLERAIKASETQSDKASIEEGVKLVQKKFAGILEGLGLKAIEAIGQPLDVDQHEAITKVPPPSPDLAGKIIDEVEKGYTLNGKVIRFTKAVVGAS
jgi:molecular chaperone GrpE